MVGRTIDRYTLVEKLGAGGMGDVYKGHHTSLDQYRAIKVLPDHLSRNPELVERFLREARRHAGLNHPNIVRVEHVGEQDGDYYMVMDFVPGKSLRQLIDDQGPLPVERSLEIALQVCLALAHAHDRGVIHRDVKPSNILVAPERWGVHGVLTDFGIARGMDGDEPGLTAAGITLGTPEYMSPEQIRGEDLDGRSDLYSLGVVLYEAVTGELPFAARSKTNVKRMHLEREPDPPSALVPELPAYVEEIILRALRKNPAERFPNAEAMAEAIRSGGDSRVAVGAEAAVGRPTPAAGRLGGAVVAERPYDFDLGRSGAAERRDRDTYDERPTPVEPEGAAGSPTVIGRRLSSNAAIPGVGAFPLPPGNTRWKLPFDAEKMEVVLQRFRKLPPLVPIAAGALLLGLTAGLLQALGTSDATRRFAAEKRTDPRTGKEFGVVLGHGVPLFVLTRPDGELSPSERAELAAQKLARMVEGKSGPALEPEKVVAVTNGRGEAVVARKGVQGRDPDPEDVIVTVDNETADSYAGTDRTALALWWRDVLRDHLRLAQGKPPVSTYDTQYGRILDRVYQEVEDERKGGWVAAGSVEKALDDLSDPHQNAMNTAWRSVPKGWTEGTATLPVQAGLVPIPRESVTVSDADPGHPALHAIDNSSTTAWQAKHGPRFKGQRHWIKVQVPAGYRLAEMQLQEGKRARPEFQLRLKQVKLTFSDGTTRRMWRSTKNDPLRITMPPRAIRWVKIEAEQYFKNPDPHESHLYLAEVKLWGM